MSKGDGNCNDELNTPECSNDAGDCQEVIEPPITIPEGCEVPDFIPFTYLGDAFCDTTLNTIEVLFGYFNLIILTLLTNIFLVPI